MQQVVRAENKLAVSNLRHMEHFFATCQGEEACYTLAGVLKRNVIKASLQGHLRTTASELYSWAISQTDATMH